MTRVATVVLAVLLLPLAAARPPILTETYLGQPAGVGCGEVAGQACPRVQNSKVQFGPFAAPDAVDIRIRDTVEPAVGAEYAFYSADGVFLRSGGLCGHAMRLRAPDGAAYLTVSLDSPANLGAHCDGLLAAYGTTGEVTLRLR